MDSFDIIIVGGGSAGAELAARLSENPATSVMLLEALRDYRADDAPAEMRSPNFVEIVKQGGFRWPRRTARFTKLQALRLYLQGRGLGGSSAINASGAGRGMPADYDGGPLRVARAGDGARCCQRSFVSKMTAISARALTTATAARSRLRAFVVARVVR